MTDLQQLHICDLFHTFQGEGKHAGRRALFVRMPFCNLSCSWCDTKFDTYTKWTDGEFMDFATKESNRFAVITGGEPMMNKHTPRVIKILKRLGFYIACETNGNFAIMDGIDYPTCSPKRDANYFIHPEAYDRVKEFKYVVDKDFDFKVLERHNTSDGKRYSLSPEFGNFEESLQRIFEYIKENPEWRISLQTHKWIKVP
jgi:7-carboxy-7-deazaguanine synthase